MKRELSKKAKLLIFKTVFVPIVTYGHEFWVKTERVPITSASVQNEVFTKNLKELHCNKVLSSEIRKSLNIKLLLLRIERPQFR